MYLVHVLYLAQEPQLEPFDVGLEGKSLPLHGMLLQKPWDKIRWVSFCSHRPPPELEFKQTGMRSLTLHLSTSSWKTDFPPVCEIGEEFIPMTCVPTRKCMDLQFRPKALLFPIPGTQRGDSGLAVLAHYHSNSKREAIRTHGLVTPPSWTSRWRKANWAKYEDDHKSWRRRLAASFLESLRGMQPW